MLLRRVARGLSGHRVKFISLKRGAITTTIQFTSTDLNSHVHWNKDMCILDLEHWLDQRSPEDDGELWVEARFQRPIYDIRCRGDPYMSQLLAAASLQVVFRKRCK